MRARKRLCSVFGFVALLATATGGWAQNNFSLDDNPTLPGSYAPAVPPFGSAEDRWGFGLSPWAVGASPSLGIFWLIGSDLLLPGPMLSLSTLPLWEIDGLSTNHTRWLGHRFLLRFSIDRVTGGVGGSAAANQFALNQQPGDIFSSTVVFPDPCRNWAGTLVPIFGPFAGALPTAGIGGSNFLVFNQGAFGLRTGGGILGPGVVAPPIANGTHDNIDAYDDVHGPITQPGGFPNFDIYYTVAPVEMVLNGLLPAAIFDNPAGAAIFPPPVPYAPPPALGLDVFNGPRTDDIDGLVVWDQFPFRGPAFGGPGAEPKNDCAIFSLSPGSATLATLQGAGWPVDPGTIFFTDFTGAFAIFALSNDIGVMSPWGPKSTNVDGIETHF